MMNDCRAQVVTNLPVARGTFHMTLSCSLPPSVPGQFVMVMVSESREHFLRRPLAVLRHAGDCLELLYKVKGEGTRELSMKGQGDLLRVLGPLGNGFSMPDPGEAVCYVAGGTGLPPVFSLAEHLGRGSLVIGARSRDDVPLWERISSIPGVTALPVTEDGSFGSRGLATDVLREAIGRAGKPSIVYACGPEGMLKKAWELAREAGARCEVSLEEYMACGFGVCSACAVKTTAGNLRVCTSGPVFDAGTIAWSA